LVPDEVTDGLPVREFRWYQGRQHYSGWYWRRSSRTPMSCHAEKRTFAVVGEASQLYPLVVK
jgi:hypothetical protein